MLDFLKKLFNSDATSYNSDKKSNQTNYRKEKNYNKSSLNKISHKNISKKVNEQGVTPVAQKENQLMPLLVSTNSKSVSLVNQIVSPFHQNQQEEITVVRMLAVIDYSHTNSDGDPQVCTLKITDVLKEDLQMISETAQMNLDEIDYKFELLDTSNLDIDFDFDVLTIGISAFACETILSKVHMMRAHEKLKSAGLYVSIARAGYIFVSSENISVKQRLEFIALHEYIIVNEPEADPLTEDIFVVQNGEIENVLNIPSLTDKLYLN